MSRTLHVPTCLAWAVPAIVLLVASASAQGPSLDSESLPILVEYLGRVRPELASKLEEADEAGQRKIVAEELGPYLARGPAGELVPTWLRWAKEELDEPGPWGWAGDRTSVLMTFGPPGGIHREPEKEWDGAEAQEAVSPWTLLLRLRGEEVPGQAPVPWELEDEYPSEVWAYPSEEGEVRVFWFVDIDWDGRMRYVLDETLPAGEQVSTAPLVEVPARLFGGAEGEIGAATPGAPLAVEAPELPELAMAGLQPGVQVSFFKASESRTFARFAIWLSTIDIELELDADPMEYLRDARFWVRIEQGEAVVRQELFSPTERELETTEDLYLAELGVPLAPGSYSWTVLVADGKNRGGRTTGSFDAPEMTGPIALSSVVLAKAEGSGEDAAIPEADLESEEFQAFRIGNYLVRPHVEGSFRAGDTLALAVVVANAPRATLEYDLYREGRFANSLEPVQLEPPLPKTDIQLIPVVEAWPPGRYKFVVTATSPGGAEVSREVSFRVRS